jgi:hypothetical protein
MRAENFPSLMKKININIKVVQQTLSRRNSAVCIQIHNSIYNIYKHTKKEKTLKAARGKQLIMQKGTILR